MNPYNSNPFENNERRELRNEYDANQALRMEAHRVTATSTDSEEIMEAVKAHAENLSVQFPEHFAVGYLAAALAIANRKRA